MSAPALRFKEFDGDWKESRLKDLALKITDGTHDTPAVQKEGIPFLTAINVKDGFINYDDIAYVDEITHKKIYERCNPEKDDLLIVNIGAGTATCARNIVDYQFSLKNVALVKPNRNLLNPIFLEQIQRKNSSRLFTSLTSGGAQPFLSLKEIGKLLIKYPSLEEQTKIASFLSAVDEKISQLSQKLHLLSQYKQGMMQKLFSQQISFKADDGSEFGEWEETILSDIVNLFHGYQFRTSDFTSKGIAVIKIGNVIGNNLDLANLTYINENRLEDFKKFEILNGDILMSLTGNIGRIIEVKNKPFILLQNYRVGKFIPLNENFLIKPFLKYLLTSDLVFGRFSQLANQSAQANFGKQDMDKITVFYPSVSEQTKIANFLSAIDQKIEVVAQQIEQAKQWKKGLLQQMFV
jgi:type I restriction enzyme S subunit